MPLRPFTQATFKQLEESQWFSHIGQGLNNEGKITVPVVILKSWSEAIQECQKDGWDLVLNESANNFREMLVKASKEEFRTWNDHVRMVKEISVPFVKSRFLDLQVKYGLPTCVEDTLRWIVTMTLVESEYYHILPTLGNHAKLAFWIVNGHFPCGWKGEFPNGNLIIF